jgi:DNA-directed RNA polymerase sigma subunit (sigma70/sigma32)
LIKPIFEKNRSSGIGRDFEATRERIRKIEAKALKKLNKRRSDDDPPDDVA